MRLLTYYADPAEATEAGARLRRAGVLTRVGGVDPHAYRPPRTDAMRVGLWVVRDDQFADAARLLDDPAHVPSRILSAEEMDEIERQAEAPRTPLRRWLDRLFFLLLGACLLGLILFTLIDFLVSWGE